MGLAERRRIATIKQNAEALQAQVKDALGFNLPITLDMSSIPENNDVLYFYESQANYDAFNLPMILRVVKEICKDDIGREAFKAKVQNIELINTSKSNDEIGTKSVELQPDGKLAIKSGYNQYDPQLWGEEDLRTEVENML
ncbi:hypothetical protein EXU57_23210 [Segetibacter sp. 3557_3]|uniref:hypothetical protein n=1 Tax=Segetibacter sp. 3557_3 TaxID=2547429 RepID=UPI0010590C6F|nr:hypothetical protein [Segetibacter sp. 3557_3]TDH18509.1 hypothetical protein EXU57_23210 [Segetibacter sp. 3557_3]